jgi:hypothetical protein
LDGAVHCYHRYTTFACWTSPSRGPCRGGIPASPEGLRTPATLARSSPAPHCRWPSATLQQGIERQLVLPVASPGCREVRNIPHLEACRRTSPGCAELFLKEHLEGSWKAGQRPARRGSWNSGDRPRALGFRGIGRAAYSHLCTTAQSRSQASATTSFCCLNWRGNMQRGLSNQWFGYEAVNRVIRIGVSGVYP